jgi:hypothetical protein
LLYGLRREIDHALPFYSDYCWSHSRALVHVLDCLFVDTVPPAERTDCSPPCDPLAGGG